MDTFKRLDLEFSNGIKIRYNEKYLSKYCAELAELVSGEDYMRRLSFAKKMMMSQELKSNNTIEGINDDLTVIDEVIKKKTSLSPTERKRIINLYHGYQYVLTRQTIDKESLKELYSILSNGLLSPYDQNNMGLYYRTKPVYILKGSHIGDDMFTGLDVDKIDSYMDQFFSYVNSPSSNNEIENFIKSQVMHFYFVYIHPFFDINGRTSRTLSLWYLLNTKAYPYIIFNQAIAFAKQDYEKSIIAGRSHGDITLFLKYMITHVEQELEKEHVIHSITENSPNHLSKEDIQLLNYILTMRSSLTVKDLATFYNHYNPPKKPNVILSERVIPLIEKGIILKKGDTKGNISGATANFSFGLNPNMVDVNPSKVKHLSLQRYF